MIDLQVYYQVPLAAQQLQQVLDSESIAEVGLEFIFWMSFSRRLCACYRNSAVKSIVGFRCV